jgi:hypothetical protein
MENVQVGGLDLLSRLASEIPACLSIAQKPGDRG